MIWIYLISIYSMCGGIILRKAQRMSENGEKSGFWVPFILFISAPIFIPFYIGYIVAQTVIEKLF